MANIGSFKKSGSEFQGEIVTLSVQTKNVRIVPETNRANDNAPSHRIYVGRADYAERVIMRSLVPGALVFRGVGGNIAPHNNGGDVRDALLWSGASRVPISATRSGHIRRSRPRRGWRRSGR
jgi:hypothetical protein